MVPLKNVKPTAAGWPVTPTIPLSVGTGDAITSAHENQVVQCLSDLWTNMQAISPAIVGAVPTTRQIIAGSGLTGGGDLSADRTLAASVVSVFGRIGAVVLQTADVSAASGVVTTGSYADPAWITSLSWSKLASVPALVNSFKGRSGAVSPATGDYTAAQVTNAVDMTGAYANPAWITSLAWAKITGAPSVGSYQTPWLQNINAAGFGVSAAASFALGKTYAETPSILYQSNGNGILQLQAHYTLNQEYPVQIGVPDSSGGIAFFTSAIVTPPTAPTFTERMRVHNAGHVGIGNDGTPIRSAGLAALHFTVGSPSLPGEICVAANQTVANSYVCGLDFGNWAIGSSNNRLAAISINTEAAANVGRLSVVLWSAGAATTPLIASALTSPGTVMIQAAASAGFDSVGTVAGQFYAYSPSNTSLIFRVRGTDGVWRQATLTLA